MLVFSLMLFCRKLPTIIKAFYLTHKLVFFLFRINVLLYCHLLSIFAIKSIYNYSKWRPWNVVSIRQAANSAPRFKISVYFFQVFNFILLRLEIRLLF